MKKRLLSLLMALLLVLTLVPTAAFAGKNETDIEYPVTGGSIWFDKSTGTVTECDTSVTEATIPAAIDGVTVKSIGEKAFYNCEKLTSITLPDSLTSIGKTAFFSCKKLASITIPDGVTEIKANTFTFCFALESVTLPDSVISMEGLVFGGCSKLTSVDIPSKVRYMATTTFADSPNLTAINVVKENPYYSSIDGVLFDNSGKTLIKYPEGRTNDTYAVPAEVTTIGNNAFYHCQLLKNLEIPAGVTSIASSAIQYNKSIESISVAEDNAVYSSADGVLFNKYKTTLIKCPENKSGAYTIPNSVKTLSSDAFNSCESLTSITIPEGITNISAMCFQSCKSLTSITIPAGVTVIGGWSFRYCNSLTSIDLPRSLKTIGQSAFERTALTTVNYAGTEEEWNAVQKNTGNDLLASAEINYLGEPHEHSYDGTWSADAEYHWQQCSDINCPNKALSIKEKTAHSFEWKTDKEATATEEGLQHEECSVCGYKRSENTVIHSYDGTWRCDSTGHWQQCSDSSCADYYSSIKNSAKHSFEWVIDKEASTSEEGLKHEECTVCGYKQSIDTVISKLPLYAAEVEDVSLTLRTGYNSSDIYALGDARLVKITNTGNQDLSTNAVSVTLTGSGADNFELNLGPVPSVIRAGATNTSWYIHPKEGLAAGTYTATIEFKDAGDMMSAPVTATVTLTVTEHPFDTTKWEHDSRTHWNPCADADCSVRGNEAAHDNAVVKDAKAATFDTDGYSGDKYCSVCGEKVENGKATAALKYIRESKAFMTPAALSADICANDLVFSSAEPEKYSVALWRVFDLTDTSLNTDSKQYPRDAKFVAGHKYAIEFKFTAVGSYVYDEMHSDYWSSFTLNGEETKLSAAVSVGGSTNRCVELTATDGTELPEVLPGDLNGDGKIDVADLIRLKKYIAGDSVELKTSGDLNDDGDINIADLIRLKKYIAGDSVTLH